MDPIPGIDLGKLDEAAQQAYRKLVQARVSDLLKGLLVQRHNLAMKAARLRTEADQADGQRKVLDDRITRMQTGDWSAVEPFEITDKALPGDKAAPPA